MKPEEACLIAEAATNEQRSSFNKFRTVLSAVLSIAEAKEV